MPPRRTHKKSKRGCQRCKLRKIKCDEVHPTCGNCSKHGVSCDFENPGNLTPQPPTPPTLPRQSTDSNSNASSASSPSNTVIPMYQQPMDLIRISSNPSSTRALELKLMHFFTASTAHTFSNNPEQNLAWQVAIPTIAYDAPFLMDAILAVSALHLRALQPHDMSLIRANHSYMASALAQYSSLLSNSLSEINAEALFSTAALIAFQASASRRFEDDHTNGYVLPLAWFHSFQGVKTIVMASWQWLRNSNRIFPIINGQPAIALKDPDQQSFFAPLLEGLDEQLEKLPESSKAETKRSYEHAVAFLNWAHRKTERSRTLGFAATVTRRFVELIEHFDPRALVIIACFFAMIKVTDDVWWLQGVAKREVNGIFSLLPPEWYPKMDWPIRVANHEGEMDPETWGFSFEGRGDGVVEEENSDIQDLKSHIDLMAQIMNDSVPPAPPD